MWFFFSSKVENQRDWLKFNCLLVPNSAEMWLKIWCEIFTLHSNQMDPVKVCYKNSLLYSLTVEVIVWIYFFSIDNFIWICIHTQKRESERRREKKEAMKKVKFRHILLTSGGISVQPLLLLSLLMVLLLFYNAFSTHFST